MSTQNDFSRSFTSNTAMSAFRRVSVSSNGAIDMAAINVLGVGVIQEDCGGQAFENPKVRFYGIGSFKVSATGNGTTAITPGAIVYAVTNGQVAGTNGTTGGVAIGIALEDSGTTVGAIIEVMPQ